MAFKLENILIISNTSAHEICFKNFSSYYVSICAAWLLQVFLPFNISNDFIGIKLF